MSDEIVIRKPGVVSYLGGACGCFGLLTMLGGGGMLVAIPMGAFNYSVEAQVAIGGATSACLGFGILLVGIVGWFLGRKKVVI